MDTVKTAVRNVCLTGSCQEWLPVVRESLYACGFQNISTDESLLCLSADYADHVSCCKISVTLTPSAFCNETSVGIVVAVNLKGASLC